MPVTARLSQAFYEKLGEQVANELVDWFNLVDATYRADLRELNELNFARFDAKVEQRLASVEARIEGRIDRVESSLNARLDRLTTALEGKLDSQVAAHAFAQIDARFDRMEAKFEARFGTMEARFGASEARFDAALQKGLRQNLAWSIVMWISVLAALVART